MASIITETVWDFDAIWSECRCKAREMGERKGREEMDKFGL